MMYRTVFFKVVNIVILLGEKLEYSVNPILLTLNLDLWKNKEFHWKDQTETLQQIFLWLPSKISPTPLEPKKGRLHPQKFISKLLLALRFAELT